MTLLEKHVWKSHKGQVVSNIYVLLVLVYGSEADYHKGSCLATGCL